MLVRGFREEDASAVARVFHGSVREVGARYYSPEQVEAWSPAPPDPEHIRARGRDGRTFLVAVNDVDEVVGFIDLENDGHIDFLYCRPDVVGAGVAFALYQQIERTARHAEIDQLFTEASEAAVAFFKRQGFVVETRRTFAPHGVDMHNYRMVKTLRE